MGKVGDKVKAAAKRKIMSGMPGRCKDGKPHEYSGHPAHCKRCGVMP